MPDFSKAVRKHVRRIRDQAYEAELHEVLRDLESGFSDWRKGRIDGFQLTDLIHGFHHGQQRALYNYYTRVKAPVAAARAIALGLVAAEDVPIEVRDAHEREIDIYQQVGEDPEQESRRR